jgi:hypothetical protein
LVNNGFSIAVTLFAVLNLKQLTNHVLYYPAILGNDQLFSLGVVFHNPFRIIINVKVVYICLIEQVIQNGLPMTKLKMLFIIAFIAASLSLTAQTPDCSVMHKGTFVYNDVVSTSLVVMTKKFHYEYSSDKKYVLKSKLEWLNNCEYKATVIKNTRPDFTHIPIGTIMRVRITKVEGNIISYSGTSGGQSFTGSFRKVK